MVLENFLEEKSKKLVGVSVAVPSKELLKMTNSSFCKK